MSSGIYVIRNKINGNFYIGSTTNFSKRKNKHFRYLRTNKHENQHLQNAFNKYGETAFEFLVIKRTDDLLNEEQKLLDEYFGKPVCYNICGTAGSPSVKGRKKTEEWKRNLSHSLTKFYINNPQHKQFLAELKVGIKLSENTRQKMKESKKRGKEHHNAKLNEQIILQIRQKYKPNEYSYGKLAEEFGVDKKTIIRIVQRKTWTHI